MIFTGNSSSVIEDFRGSMTSNFEMADSGLLHYFLGMQISQTPEGIFMCQNKYARGLLKRFNMLDCNPAKTPMNINEKLLLDDGGEKADSKEFRSLIIRGLIYLTHSRPDILFAVSLLSRFMQNPSKLHSGAAKSVLRYIYGTLRFGIRLQQQMLHVK